MSVQGVHARRMVLGAGLTLAVAALWCWPAAIQEASARGETRTLSMFNIHTKETITVTFKRDGKYDPEALKQFNHMMRDWRRDESRQMDPALIDLIWTLHQSLGSKEPVKLISGYRSATTNNSLRRKGGGQAKNSQHIQGKAADIQFPDVPVKTLRNSALIQEWGGVGYYPTSGVPFVHVDTGRVRMWPRIPRLELAALFPDGRSKYLPIDGKPITPRDYQLAQAKGLTGKTMMASAGPKPVSTPDAVVADTTETPRAILASYTPEPAAAPTSAKTPVASAPIPERKRFVYANAGGGLPAVASPLVERGFPLYSSADVVGAPEVDDDHPDELSYVPFDISGLMSDVSVSYNHEAAELIHPEQHDLAFLFDDMDQPQLSGTFRKTSPYRGLAAAQSFSGQAIRSVYAELRPQLQRTRLAQSEH